MDGETEHAHRWDPGPVTLQQARPGPEAPKQWVQGERPSADSPAAAGQERHALLLIASSDIRWEGLRSLLRREPLIRLVGVVSPEEALAAVKRRRPDGVLMAI